jgi:hypothetical protein
VLQFEISEERDQIKLASLRRVADAMDCDLVYSIVPRRTAGLTVGVMGAKGTNRKKSKLNQESKINNTGAVSSENIGPLASSELPVASDS